MMRRRGVLATVDDEGRPCLRWMTPRTLKGRPGAIYALAVPSSDKVCQLRNDMRAEWMIQTRSLTEVVNLRGRIRIVDNPSLKMEIIENMGNQLFVFWKVNPKAEEFIVLEMVVEEGKYYAPMKGVREKVEFAGERV